MVDYLSSVPFWRLKPNYTCLRVDGPDLMATVLAEEERNWVIGYICSLMTGQEGKSIQMYLRLLDGAYKISYIRPVDGEILGDLTLESQGLNIIHTLELPHFIDDLVVQLKLINKKGKSLMEGTL